MFAMFKLCVLLALAAPFASALTITTVEGNVVSEGSITINWSTSTSDASGTFSIELNHPSFNSALALANNVDSSSLSKTIALPNVPAEDGYTITFVDISDVNAVFATSAQFAIGAVSATQSTTVKGVTVTSKSSSSAANSGSGTGTNVPVSTKPAPSGTPSGASNPILASNSNSGSASPTAPSGSTPSTSATGTGGALTTRASGALLALGVAGALAFAL